MSVSHYGLENIMGKRMDEMNRHLANIAGSLAWISSCHYQQFTPMVEKRPEPFIPKKTWTASTQHITTGSLPF